MTNAIELHPETISANPLDRIEEILIANDWAYKRMNSEELCMDMNGENGEYAIILNWMESKHALKMQCQIQQSVPHEKLSETILLLTEINQSLVAGHFSISREDTLPSYYYSAFFKDENSIGDMDYLEWIMHTALDQCERFSPLFKWLSENGDLEASDLSLILMEHEGNA